ncbi:hypothetical protein [Mycolicibacterium goodii]|uniref:hypothetical protein n=1 Tax=Mycolicibacterium goodii TaxID=134601 RepID=UPI000AD19A45|nr:hypothetical protein [Mycolicibacterium goodii]
MEVAARSRLLAGAAIVGAGALVAAPIQPVPATIASPIVQSTAPAVELTALVNPIELWADVIAAAVGNVGGIVDTVLENPAPILGNVVDNQLISAQVLASFAATFGEGLVTGVGGVPAALQAATEQILAGQIYDGVSAFAVAFITPVVQGAFGALLQLGDVSAVLQNPFVNAANVVGTIVSVPTLIGAGLPILLETLAPVMQLGLTGQAIYDGVTAGDFEAVANALISLPSDMVGTILNGNQTIGNSGIIGSGFGLIPSLLSVRQAIADALQPPAVSTLAAQVTSTPEPSVNSFTLTVDEVGAVDEVGGVGEPETVSDTNIQAVAAKSTDQGSVVAEAGTEVAAAETVVQAETATEEAAVETEAEQPTETADKTAEKSAEKSNKPLVTLGNKFTPGAAGEKAHRPGQRAGAALKSIGDEVGKAVKKIGDDVKKALGVKKTKKAESGASSDNGGGAE